MCLHRDRAWLHEIRQARFVVAAAMILTIPTITASGAGGNEDRLPVGISEGIAQENHIPGAWPAEATSSVPLYLNSPSMYYPTETGGICWASATASILGYWDRNSYNGTRYWNLFAHGTAPLLELSLPSGPGHSGADVKSVVEWFAHEYYVVKPPLAEDQIIRNFVNGIRGLDFSVSYESAATDFAGKSSHFSLIQTDIDAGRPVSIGSWGNYFGGPHQVPVTGYREMSNMVESVVFVHRNTGDLRREYVNFFTASWNSLDMNRIIPGGEPEDPYEVFGDNGTSTQVTIDPDHTYAFRQTRSLGVSGDEDWVRLEGRDGQRYTIATTGPGPDSDTALTLFADGGAVEVKQDTDGGDEAGTSLLEWHCWSDQEVLIRVSCGVHGSYGPAAFYHLEATSSPTAFSNRPPVLMGLEPASGESIQVKWESLPDQRYRVEFSTNLQEGFHVLASNLFAAEGIHAYLDGQPLAPVKFYRITTGP